MTKDETRNRLLYFSVAALVPLVIGFVPVSHLATFAYHTGEQSYILLVPFVCGALIYYSRDRILSQTSFGITRKTIVGIVVSVAILGSSYLLLDGSEGQLAAVALGLIASWVTAFWICFGPVALKKASFEFAMLLWIVPIPATLIESITVTLQKASTELCDVMFRATTIPVYRDGFFFHLPGQSIEVAKACSGIRSTLSLLFLTLIIAHESLVGNWRRLALVLSALPIVILKNGVRIVSLTLLAIYVDPSFLTGPLHHDGGIVFFLIGLVMLMPILALLRRGEPTTGSTPTPDGKAVGAKA